MGLLQNLPEGENLPSELAELGKVIIEAGKKLEENALKDAKRIPSGNRNRQK